MWWTDNLQQAVADARGFLDETATGHLISPREWMPAESRRKAMMTWALFWSGWRLQSVAADDGESITFVRESDCTPAVAEKDLANDKLWYEKRLVALEQPGRWTEAKAQVLRSILERDLLPSDWRQRLAHARHWQVRIEVVCQAVKWLEHHEVDQETLERWAKDRSKRVREAARSMLAETLTL